MLRSSKPQERLWDGNADTVIQSPFVERRTMQKIEKPNLIKFAKSRAKKLRQYLADQGLTISHSQSLEATAQAEGFKDWNTYTARFKLAEDAVPTTNTPISQNEFPLHVGDRISGEYRGSQFEGSLIGLEKTITNGVWRAVLKFDKPVELPGTKALKHTRQRVSCMLNENGMSVNLKGTPDGFTAINMP